MSNRTILNWSPRFAASAYKIYRSVGPIDTSLLPSPIATLPGTSTEFVDVGVLEKKRYYYVLECVNKETPSKSVFSKVQILTSGEASEIVGFTGPPAIRSQTTSDNASSTIIPIDAVVGDVLFIQWAAGGSGPVLDETNTPPGWTLHAYQRYDRARSGIYYKACELGDAGSVIDFNGGGSAVTVALSISNADISDLFDVLPQGSGVSSNRSSHTLTPVNASSNALILGHVCGGWGGAFTYTPPTGATEVADFRSVNSSSSGCVIGSAQRIDASPITAPMDFVCSASLHYSGFSYSIKNHY